MASAADSGQNARGRSRAAGGTNGACCKICVMDFPTALSILTGGAFCYAAWLTSIVFCAASGQRPR